MMPRERRSAIARPALCSVITAPHRSTSLQHSRQLTPHFPRRCSRRSSLPSGPIYFSVPAHLLALEAGSIHLTEGRGVAAAGHLREELDDKPDTRGNARRFHDTSPCCCCPSH